MKEETTEQIKFIKRLLNNATDISLDIDVNGDIGERIYDNKDLLNASLLFAHVMGNISADYLITRGGDLDKALETTGKEIETIRQCILNLTGIDTHNLADELGR